MPRRKIEFSTENIKEEISQAIGDWVRAKLEGSPASRSSFLAQGTFQRYLFQKSFRRKMLKLRAWEPICEFLANQQLDQLLIKAVKRHERAASDEAQFFLPGFENLPRRIRISKRSFVIERSTVAELLTFQERYEQRAHKDRIVGEELKRLAGLVRDQPHELSVPEAVARVQGKIRQSKGS